MNLNLHHLSQKSTDVSSRNILRDLLNPLNELNRGELVTLNHIIGQYLFYDYDMHESQATIGIHTGGRSRQTINNHISTLKSKNLITVEDLHQGKYNNDSLRYIPNKLLFKFKFYLYEKLNALRKASWMTLQKLNLIGFLTPHKKIFISKPCKYISQLLEKDIRGMKLKNKFEKRKIEMDEADNIVISATLRDITEKLRLTKLGQLKLLSFSDDVLRIVWKSYHATKNVKSPFDWMVVGCEQYSIANKISVDWPIFYSLLKRYKVEDNKVYVRKEEPKNNHLVTTVTTSKSVIPRWKTFTATEVAKGFEYFDQQRTKNLQS